MTAEEFTIEQLATEEWMPVVGFELLYEVSSLGRVRRIGYHHNAKLTGFLKPAVTQCGYVTVPLSKPGVKARPHSVHRLVMAAFAYPVVGRMTQVNHKDGNKKNNLRENLEYVTPRENTLHAIKMGLRAAFPVRTRTAKGDTHYSRTKPWAVPRGEKHGRAKITENTVQLIRADYAEMKSYTKVAQKYGIGKTTVMHIIKGHTWKSVPIITPKDR